MQQFVNISPKLMCLLTLILYAETVISREVSLNDQFANCAPPNCTIVLYEGEHTVSESIVVEDWDYFKLTAPKQTIIRCIHSTSEDYTAFRINRTNTVVIENITFVNCSQPTRKIDLYKVTAIVSIEWAVSVYLDSCYFPNYSQVALELNNTEKVELRNSYFKATKEHTYKRAVVYEASFSKNVMFYAHNLTLDGANISHSKEPKIYLSFKTQQGIGGGLVLIMQNIGSVHALISNSTIVNCKAILGGGVFFQLSKSVTEYHVTVVGSVFENNSATQSKIGKGGAMVVRSLSEKGVVLIENCTFQYNTAVNGGAVGILLYDQVGDTHTHILDSVFKNNSAKIDSGGAIYAENLYISNKNHLNIQNTQFALNLANSGGAIFTINLYLDLDDNVNIHDNIAYYGGGICLLSSWLSLSGDNITIERNTASHSGGALYVHSSSIVKAHGHETIIANNTATIRGGGIFVYTKYFENQRHDGRSNWRNDGKLFSFYCFLQTERAIENALILSDNKVSGGMKLCMGDDLFTNTWGPCYVRGMRNPLSPAIVFKDEAINKCSIALDIVHYNVRTNLISPCQLMIGKDIKPTNGCSETLGLTNLPDYYKRLKQAFRLQGVEFKEPTKVHLFFPGYESQIDIESLDGMKNPIQTMTQIVFKPNNLSLIDSSVLAISLSGSKNFTIKKLSHDFIFGKICLRSYSTLNKVTQCEDAIIGDCPSPLLSARDRQSCELKHIPKLYGHGIKDTNPSLYEKNKFSIQMNPGMLFTYPENKSKKIVFMHCTWFQCNCHISANIEDCVFNVNAPEKQCREELKFPYCTECKDENKRICPPFNWFCPGGCFKCEQPYITIVAYVILTLVITVIICLLPLDVFSDYMRSIVFYSSTLYVLCINCGTYENHIIYRFLSVPIDILNLLVTHMFPFCLPTNEPIYLAIFNMTAPFIFVVYIAIIVILVTKVPYISRLGQFELVNKLWTIIVLTYVHLCNQAFSVLNCPINSLDERTWMYDGDMRCLVGLHLVGSIIAILLLFALITFPIIMLIFSRSQNPDYQQFVKTLEGNYKAKYKYWELIKLYLRVLFPFMVTLLPQAIRTPGLPCSVISIFCLLLLILNSLMEPATNHQANQFESLCFLILAFMGFQNESSQLGKYIVNVTVLIPYLIYSLVLVYKLINWLGERKRLINESKRISLKFFSTNQKK